MLEHFVVQTHLSQDRLANSEVSKLGYMTTWLVVSEEIRTAHGRHIRTTSLFPCYLFVLFDLHEHKWQDIVKCRGVKNILGHDPLRPQPLKHGTVWELQKRFAAIEFKPAIVERPIAAAPIAEGQLVLVDTGGTELKPGVCKVSRKDRIRVLMECLGGEREVEVDIGRVTPFYSKPAEIESPPAH